MSATFGKEDSPNIWGQRWGQMVGSYFFCPERGLADSITVSTDVWYSIPVKVGIYRKSDGAFIGETEEKLTNSAGGRLTLNFISKPELENIEYWLVLFSSAQIAWGGRITRNLFKFGVKNWATSPYPVFPPISPLGIARGVEHSFVLGIYCTYTPLGVPPEGYTITITNTEGGVTDPAGQYIYAVGSVATVVAMRDSGYVFDHWELDGIPITDNPISVLMDTAHIIQAVFTFIQEGIAKIVETNFPAALSPGSWIVGSFTLENVGTHPDNFQCKTSFPWIPKEFETQQLLEPGQSLKLSITSASQIIMPEVDVTIILEASHYEVDHWMVDDVATVTISPMTTATLQGTITDAETGTPIEGVQITCDGYSGVTDANGFYNIAEMPAAIYTVTASAPGYMKRTIMNVDISTGYLVLNILLSPALPTPPPTIESPLLAIAPAIAGALGVRWGFSPG